MGGADMVHAEFLHQFDTLFHGTGIGSSTERTKGVVVGITLEQHFLAVYEQALARNEINLAYTEALGHLVAHGSVFAQQSDCGGIEVGVVAVPKLRIGNVNSGQSKLLSELVVTDTFQLMLLVADHCSVRSRDDHLHGNGILFGLALHVDRHVHISVFACGDMERMAVEVELGIGIDDVDIAEESAAGIPARISGVGGVGIDGNDVLLAIAQVLGDIDFKAYIAIVGAANLVAVEIDISKIHDTLEINEDAFALILLGRGKGLDIPSRTHLLETSGREAALDIGSGITVVGFLVGCGCHPWLFNLEIMRQIDFSPATGLGLSGRNGRSGFSLMEKPSTIDIGHLPV